MVQTKKLQKLQPINQFVESIFVLAISKKDLFFPNKLDQTIFPSAAKTKRIKQFQETSAGSFISKKNRFKKKNPSKKEHQTISRNILKISILQQKKPNRSQNFIWISSRSPGPGAFYITVGRAISSSSDAAETVLRRRLVPSEGGKLWCFDIRGARHEIRGERKDVFRWKTKKQPRKRGRFLEVEVEWLILFVFFFVWF